MTNPNMVRKNFGYNFIFEDFEMALRFLELYGDLFIDYELTRLDGGYTHIKIVYGEKGVIKQIKDGLKGLIERHPHHRSFVRKEA